MGFVLQSEKKSDSSGGQLLCLGLVGLQGFLTKVCGGIVGYSDGTGGRFGTGFDGNSMTVTLDAAKILMGTDVKC
jgi:hypothetical protein